MSQMPPPQPPPLPPHSSNDPLSSYSGGGATDTFPELMPPTAAGPLGGTLPAHRGSTIMGLGIASLGVVLLDILGLVHPMCCCGSSLISIGLAIPALLMANADLKLMAAGQMDPAGRSNTNAGKICAIIALVVAGLAVVLAIVGVIAGVAIFSMMGANGGKFP